MAKQTNFQKFVREVYRFVNTAIERIKKADRRFLMMVGIAIVIVIVLIVLICVGISSGKDDNVNSSANLPNDSYIVEEGSTDYEIASDVVTKNGAGSYVVSTGSAADLNMRPTAGTEYSPIVAIPNGTSVQVLFVDDSSSPSWGYIEYNGERGWVSMDYLKAE